ncbi:thiamine phosphate synthase [Evtepia sp.]|uniref:thiamine phosphate synthase n=1 Tax=Evtepia sp. TaxID=2773933 RepID=UPI002E7883F2|nr:thiamine phosphate synthase [Evtepia sp.]MEE0747965.1 thiamine phosphate synthase [Evtepia sp.]
MFDLLCLTDRTLCREPFLDRVAAIAAARPAALILREKDLPEDQYQALAAQVMALCQKAGVPCILHTFVGAARALGARAIHLPLPVLRTLSAGERAAFPALGASCHSVEEAREAVALGATYLTAGHVFATTCKAGLPGRGVEFLAQVCAAVPCPVYAIGGVGPENLPALAQAGAKGGCVRSPLMTCPDPGAYLRQWKEAAAHVL